jgi:competence protein ComEC
VIGDTSLQSEAFTEQMRRVGLSHLTAVSGANFALVASFLFWLLQFIVKNLKNRLRLIFLILMLFIFLVRPTPSVLRAAVMTAVVLIAKFFGEKSLGIPSLSAAITLLILLDPLQAIDPGFVLSVLATAGILILSPFIEQKLSRYIRTEWIVQGISIPVSATLFCLPVIVLISGQLSLVTVPANILVAPVIAPITVLGFISAILSPFVTTVAQLLFTIATPFAAWIVFVSKLMADIPLISFNQSGVFICLFLIVFLAIIKKRIQIALLILILFIGRQLILKIWIMLTSFHWEFLSTNL